MSHIIYCDASFFFLPENDPRAKMMQVEQVLAGKRRLLFFFNGLGMLRKKDHKCVQTKASPAPCSLYTTAWVILYTHGLYNLWTASGRIFSVYCILCRRAFYWSAI